MFYIAQLDKVQVCMNACRQRIKKGQKHLRVRDGVSSRAFCPKCAIIYLNEQMRQASDLTVTMAEVWAERSSEKPRKRKK